MPVLYTQLRLCSAGGGFEAVPVRRLALDLRRVRAELEARAAAVVDARVMLIVTVEGVEATISRAGRLLFKTGDSEAARRAFAFLEPLLGLPSR